MKITSSKYQMVDAKEALNNLCQVLQNHGIDTTKHTYELMAESYERYTPGTIYKFKFKCPGDYLAYLAMFGHQDVKTLSGLLNTFSDAFGVSLSNFNEFDDDCPETVDEMYDLAQSTWYGDGDDFIIYLKNLDTGEVLYESDYTFEEDDDEYEDW